MYEEVVLPDGGTGELVDVAEVEVGDGRSASPVKIGALSAATTAPAPKSRKKKAAAGPPLGNCFHDHVISMIRHFFYYSLFRQRYNVYGPRQ